MKCCGTLATVMLQSPLIGERVNEGGLPRLGMSYD